MRFLSKILPAILILLAIILGFEVYQYLQLKNQLQVKAPGPAKEATKSGFPHPSPQPKLALVEIQGLALVGHLNLSEISKEQVEKWASTSGTLTVPAYTGSLPTLPPELSTLSAQFTPAVRPSSTRVLAGYFKRLTANREIVLAQGETELIVSVNPAARLWKKEKNKLQIVSIMLDNLLNSGTLSQYVQEGDLLLLPGIQEQAGQFKTSVLVVFK